MKVCSKCKIEKDESEFGKDKKRKDGLNCHCKNCCRLYSLNLSAEVKIKKNEYNKNYNKNNKEKRREIEKRSKIKNKDKIRETQKQYRELNKAKRNDYVKKWIANNKLLYNDIRKKSEKKRIKNDNSYKIKLSIRKQFSFRVKKNMSGSNFNLLQYTGVSYAEYITYFENNYPLEFAEITVKGKYHIDHIIPCAIYDFNNPEHIKLCWQPENLRIIPAKENLEKNDKLDFDLIKKHNIEHLLPKDKRRLA